MPADGFSLKGAEDLLTVRLQGIVGGGEQGAGTEVKPEEMPLKVGEIVSSSNWGRSAGFFYIQKQWG